MSRLFRRKTARARRFLVLGLDCASPHLIFEAFRSELPTLSALMDGGTWGIMRSSLPCITVPAWASMFSGRDAGELGVYGFRNRADHTYSALTTATSEAVRYPRVWDVLSAHDKPSLVVNVPQTTPLKPLKGAMIGDFSTPSLESAFAYPPLLKAEVLKHFPSYCFDAGNFRTADKADLLQRIYDLTDVQYRVFQHLLKTREWSFAVHVNMGVDRVHHGFWRYHDPKHRLYEAGHPFNDAIRAYYRFVDEWLGRLLAQVGDETSVLIVSDHGVKRMDGAIAINDWLWRKGWLALKHAPQDGEVVPFSVDNVDWARTRAWSTGGYYARIFLNVAGREPQGTIAPHNVDATLDELATQLQTIPSPQGTPLQGTRVFRPRDVYRAVNGVAPDLIVYFGDLHWRAVGGLGYPAHYTLDNDTGPDDANHAEEGMFILHEAGAGQGQIAPRQLMDVAPTVLQRLGVPRPVGMGGEVFP